MLVIRTKYHGPGNVRGSRVSARRESSYVPEGETLGRRFYGWNDELSTDANHRGAAMAWLREHNQEIAEAVRDGAAMLVEGDVGAGYVYTVFWMRDLPTH